MVPFVLQTMTDMLLITSIYIGEKTESCFFFYIYWFSKVNSVTNVALFKDSISCQKSKFPIYMTKKPPRFMLDIS